jgi:hypothetical protein
LNRSLLNPVNSKSWRIAMKTSCICGSPVILVRLTCAQGTKTLCYVRGNRRFQYTNVNTLVDIMPRLRLRIPGESQSKSSVGILRPGCGLTFVNCSNAMLPAITNCSNVPQISVKQGVTPLSRYRARRGPFQPAICSPAFRQVRVGACHAERGLNISRHIHVGRMRGWIFGLMLQQT